MEMRLDCLPCLFRQALEAARMATDDEELIKEILNDYAELVPEIDSSYVAPGIVNKMHDKIKRKTGVEDIYYDFKKKHVELALELYPEVEDMVKKSADSLKAALVMAATGNSIDAGVSLEIDVNNSIKAAIEDGFTYSDFDLFKERLERSKEVLIIGDNSGEAVFDRLLMKRLAEYDVNITYAVRDVPILNDITLKEARELKLDEVSNLISSGCHAPGMLMEQASDEFLKVFNNADIIISKGQGNYEGLSNVESQIFFLLKAKCSLIARLLEVEEGSLVFKFKS